MERWAPGGAETATGDDTTCRGRSSHCVLPLQHMNGVQAMFWILISLCALAYTFVKVGALSVMVKVLTVSLLGAAVVLVVLVLFMLWRTMRRAR